MKFYSYKIMMLLWGSYWSKKPQNIQKKITKIKNNKQITPQKTLSNIKKLTQQTIKINQQDKKNNKKNTNNKKTLPLNESITTSNNIDPKPKFTARVIGNNKGNSGAKQPLVLHENNNTESPNHNNQKILNQFSDQIPTNNDNNNDKILNKKNIPDIKINNKTTDNKSSSITNNNKEIIADYIPDAEDILEIYSLPKIEDDDPEKLEDYQIKSHLKVNGLYEKPTAKISKPQLLSPVTKGKAVNRPNNNVNDKHKDYIPLLEDGKTIKRSFTIPLDIAVDKFLMDQGIDEYDSAHIQEQIKKNMAITQLSKNQYVIILLKKKNQYYDKHIINNQGQYYLKKMIIFFDNGFISCKWIENMQALLFNKVFYNCVHKDFFIINCKNVEDFSALNPIIKFFPNKCYDFFAQSIDFLINKNPDLKINNIKLILQNTYYNNVRKVHLRGFFIYTVDQVYKCYIFKDFSDNYHLLNKNGDSCNLELLDLQQNPPVNGIVSSLCGVRFHPVLKKQKHHDGIDISAPNNTLVFGTMNGWVFSSGFNKFYGNYVIISYGNNIYSLYGHLNNRFVATGDYIENGSVIGTIGNTGRSTGNHLHYEIFQSNFKSYTLNEDKLGYILSNRVILNPGYVHEIGVGVREPELKYFKNLVKYMDQLNG